MTQKYLSVLSAAPACIRSSHHQGCHVGKVHLSWKQSQPRAREGVVYWWRFPSLAKRMPVTSPVRIRVRAFSAAGQSRKRIFTGGVDAWRHWAQHRPRGEVVRDLTMPYFCFCRATCDTSERLSTFNLRTRDSSLAWLPTRSSAQLS